MAVTVRGRVHKLKVFPGAEGKAIFKQQVRSDAMTHSYADGDGGGDDDGEQVRGAACGRAGARARPLA